MWAADDLSLWSRPQDVLLPNEEHRVQEYLDLYQEQLKLMVAATKGKLHSPSVTCRAAAYRRAVLIWDFNRVTTDIRTGALKRARDCLTRSAKRQEQFADADIRRKLDQSTMDGLDDAERFALLAEGTFETNVVPIEGTRRKQA